MSTPSRESAGKVAVVTIHGTGDTAPGPQGDKWFQRGSAFSEALKQRLAARGLDAEIVPFLWSGANSAAEREKAADRLAATITRIAPRYSGVHLVGHSHGGNVANDAIVRLRWGRRRQRADEIISSVTTIGTPFLNSRSSMLQSLGRLLFLAVAIASLPLFVVSHSLLLLWVTDVADPFGVSEGFGTLSDNRWLIWWGCVIAIGVPLWFMLRLAVRAWRRMTRPRSQAAGHARVFSVWHGNDEAISFLQQIEGLPLEPFPLGSLLRGSRGVALSAGAVAVVLGALAPTLIWAARSGGYMDAAWASPYWFWTSTLTMVFVAPLLFALVYVLIRLFAVSAGEVVARPRLNRWIASVLRGIAFGKDGDQSIGQVNPRSHTHGTREHIIGGELAQRMQTNAESAAAKLIERYRWALFTVGSDTNGALSRLATDAMTWSSLIHTTYFEQPEVVNLIADYIGDEEETLRSTASAPQADGAGAPPRRRNRVATLGVGAGVALAAGAALFWLQPNLLDLENSYIPPSAIQPPAASAETVGALFRDCANCPEMTLLTGGVYMMGAAPEDPGRRPWEGPQHEVAIPSFAISVHEVTFDEWDACTAAGGCGGYAPSDGGRGRGARPVASVSWNDAQDYVRWLSQTTGRAYRLPSEAQWEFAARAGVATPYWWGEEHRPGMTPRGAASPVGDLAANAFGLRGVTGNVAEWVEDCYVNNYADAPTDGRAVTGAGCATRVVRGGSFRDAASALRIASRSRIRQSLRDSSIGFRVVAPAPSPEAELP